MGSSAAAFKRPLSGLRLRESERAGRRVVGKAVVRNRPEGILGDVKGKGGERENDEEAKEGGGDATMDAVNGRESTLHSAPLAHSLIDKARGIGHVMRNCGLGDRF